MARKAVAPPITSTSSTRTATGSTRPTSSTAPRASIRTWDSFRASTCVRPSSSSCAASIPRASACWSSPRTSTSWGTWTTTAFSRIGVSIRRSTFGGAGLTDIFERFQNINFRRHDANVFLHTEYFKRATLDLNYSAGTRINYTPAAGLAPFLANGNELQATLTLRPAARLKIDQIYYLTRMHTAGTSVFVNHLPRSQPNHYVHFRQPHARPLLLRHSHRLVRPSRPPESQERGCSMTDRK